MLSAGGNAWPSNTLLYIGVSATSTVSKTDPIASRCPLVITTPQLSTDDDYYGSVLELLEARGRAGAGGAAGEIWKRVKRGGPPSLDIEVLKAAKEWMEKPNGGMSVRTAASFVKLLA